MKIMNYNDLRKVSDNTIVDLSSLSSRDFIRVVDFLAGLTYKKGSLTKLEKNKFLVKLEEK